MMVANNLPPSQKNILPNPLFPHYFHREGYGTKWYYKGFSHDTLRVWRTFFWLIFQHPLLTIRGIRTFYIEIVYRLSFIPDSVARLLSILGYPFAILTPIIFFPLAFLLAALPVPRPLMFRPFSTIGLTNYCGMLAIVSIYHTNLRIIHKVPPTEARKYASKLVWREFFAEHLLSPYSTTELYATIENGAINGNLPKKPFVIKPTSSGAGYKLYGFDWSEQKRQYIVMDHCFEGMKSSFTEKELLAWIKTNYSHAIIESFEQPRSELARSSLRILTIRFGDQVELLSLALLVAPPNEISTAHAEVLPYLVDVPTSRVTKPCLPATDQVEANDGYCNREIPELHGLIRQCLALHEKIPIGQVEISWDIILTNRGPIFLEGNIIPPGCDYKLMIFENASNLNYFLDRYSKEIKALL